MALPITGGISLLNNVTNRLRVDVDKVGQLEDMVRKNSEYQKLLQNKIKEMQNSKKQEEEEAAGREHQLVERVKELELQIKDQVSSFYLGLISSLTGGAKQCEKK